MSIHRTSQLILAGVLLVSLVTVGSVLFSMRLRHQLVAAFEARTELLKMADQLVAGSDRLTAAVRGYAATGDRRYHEAFKAELLEARSRDLAMASLEQLGASPAELALFREAKQNSDALVGLEDQALEAAGHGDLKRAVALVYGEEYLKAKRSIMEPLAAGRARLDARLSERAQRLGKAASTGNMVSLSAMTLNLLTVLAAITLFYNQRVVNPLVAIRGSIQELAEGKAETRVGYTEDSSELGDLARALESYRHKTDEAEKQRWVKAGCAEIAELVDGVETPAEFGARLLSGLVPRLGGACGAFFLWHDDERLFRFSGGYACLEGVPFAPGAGLAGQAAAERRLVLMTELPPGYLKVRSGVGEGDPSVVAALPLTLGERVLALVEVACLAQLSPQQLELFGEVGAMAALKLEVLNRNQRTRELLDRVRASEERSRLILESSDQGIFGTDLEGRVTFVNPAACKMLGFTPEEMLGQSVHELIHHHRPDGSVYPAHECPMREAWLRGVARRVDDEFLWRKDGVGLPVEYATTPILKDGAILGGVVTFTDISERRRTS